jgi:hypothetical protein
MDALFPSPFIVFILYLLFFLSFYFKVWPENTALAWWPELTVLPTGISAEMIRLARDETPFPLAMQPKVIALAWWPDNGNVILLDTYEHNGSARDETSHPLG